MAERKAVGKIVPGRKIGDLTVLFDTGERKYHCVVWRCRCGLCGNEVDLISRDFSQRGFRDCGCGTGNRRTMIKIRPGDQFGLLTVLSDSGGRKGSEIIWKCRCSCGNEIQANTTALRSGRAKDCGCVSSLKTNLMGRQFGCLTVVGDEGTKAGNHVWLCQCTCGNKCSATSSHLTHGQVRSCGCLRDSVWEENLKLVEGTSVTKLEARRADTGRLVTTNTSGYNGVYPQNSHGRKTGRWVAQIGFRGRKFYLGAFDRAEDAAEARKAAEERLYDGFIDWYYSEYLPGQRHLSDAGAADAARYMKTTRGEQGSAKTAAAP